MPFPAFFDNTLRSTFVACPLKFKRSFVDNLTPAAPSIHLHAGGAFAAGLDRARKCFYGTMQMDEVSALAEGATEIIRFWGDFPFEHPDKGLERVLLAFDDYFREYRLPFDHIKPILQDGEPTTEFNFAVPLPIANPDTGEPIVYTGRFDMLGVYQDALFVVDEKTSTQLGQSWAQQWDLKSQFTGYCAMARLYDYPVVGAIIRGVGFLKSSTTFAQVIQYRPEWQIDRWYAQLLRDIKRAVDCYTSGEWDVALDEACASYGGCAFRRLCLSQTPENWIDGYFVERNWNPLAKF